MAKYARKKDGCWIDVYTAPGDFPDLTTLKRCLPGDDFCEVAGDVKHGDFVEGESGFISRPEIEREDIPAPKTEMAILLEKVDALQEKLGAVEAKVDAIVPTV